MTDRLVIVEWLDTVTDHGWTDWGEAVKEAPHTVRSAGWLIYEDDQKIVLATSKSGGQVNGTTIIPRPWVVKTITTL